MAWRGEDLEEEISNDLREFKKWLRDPIFLEMVNRYPKGAAMTAIARLDNVLDFD
jgi:hypothetical protein